jgi:hypothetical protein
LTKVMYNFVSEIYIILSYFMYTLIVKGEIKLLIQLRIFCGYTWLQLGYTIVTLYKPIYINTLSIVVYIFVTM